MEIVFTELLLFTGMKQAMINKRRSGGGGVAVCFRKTRRFLSCDSSPFSTKKTVTVSRTLDFLQFVSSFLSWQTITARFLSMLLSEANAFHGIAFRPLVFTIPLDATLRGQCIPGHGLAFGPLVDLLFPKMNEPLLTSVPKKAYSGNGNLHRCGSLRI